MGSTRKKCRMKQNFSSNKRIIWKSSSKSICNDLLDLSYRQVGSSGISPFFSLLPRCEYFLGGFLGFHTHTQHTHITQKTTRSHCHTQPQCATITTMPQHKTLTCSRTNKRHTLKVG